VFDTGANYSVLTLSLAKSLGLALSEATIPVDAITGGEVAARLAVVPEFRLGAAVVKNAVFLVFEDRDLYIAPLKHQIRGIVGFPVIAALGRLTFRQTGEIEIGMTRSSAADAGEPNLYLEERTPLVAAASGGQTLLFTLDSGATQSVLFATYYKLHRAEFSGKPVAQDSTGAGGTRANLAFYKESLELHSEARRLSHVPVYTRSRHRPRFFYGNSARRAEEFERSR
jgi:hypothetical protein